MDKLTDPLSRNHICEEDKPSMFLAILKYPALYYSLSGIYIPHVCESDVLTTKDTTRGTVFNNKQTIRETELTRIDENITDSNANRMIVFTASHNYTEQKLNNKLTTNDYVTNIRPQKIKHVDKKSEKRCPNNKNGGRGIYTCNGWLNYFKIAFCSIYVIFEILDIVRLIIIMNMTVSDDSQFIHFLANLIYRLFILFLNVTSSCTNFNNFRTMCCACLKYERKYGFMADFNKCRKRTRTFFAVGVFVNICISLGMFIGVLTTFDIFHLQTWPLDTDIPISKGIAAIIYASLGFIGSCNTFSVHLFRGTIIQMLNYEFQHLRLRMHTVLSEPVMHSQTEEEFGQLIEQLELLQEIAQETFQLLKHTIAAAYVFTPILLCLVLYNVAGGSMVWKQGMLTMYTVGMVVLMITSTTKHCAELRGQARSVWSGAYNAPWYNHSPAMLNKLSIFMNQLSVDDVSYSVYGMFTVDYPSLLMVGGTVLTYGMFVLQLRLDKKQ